MQACKFIITVVLIVFSFTLFSQVEKSTTKKIINGKTFLIHKVKQGETLFAISKVYEVSREDIAMENPIVFEGLQPDMELKIPLKTTVYVEDENFQVHIVEAGETLYGITRKYKLDANEIASLNPEVSSGLKPGQKLRIPKKHNTSQYHVEKNSKYLYHVVEAKQTLYSLSKQYNVDINEIYSVNPGLKEAGLKEKDVIKIPNKNYSPPLLVFPEDNQVKDTIPEILDEEIPVSLCDSFNYKEYGKPFNIALFIPLYAAKNSAVDVKKVIQEQQNFYPGTRFIEFYEGVLLALDSLKNSGISINLTVYDTAKDSARIATVLQDSKMKDIDLIIGPFFKTTLEPVAEFAKDNNIPIVSPHSSKSDFISENPNLIFLNPNLEILVDETAKKTLLLGNLNVILVKTGIKASDQTIDLYKAAYEQHKDSVAIIEIDYASKGMSGIISSLKADKNNIVVYTATDRSTVLKFINFFYADVFKMEKTFITLLGMPIWKNYDNIEVENLHDLQFMVGNTSYVDYNHSEVKQFIRKYRKVYHTEPSDRSFMGYDIMMFFGKILYSHGKDFIPCLPDYKQKLLCTDFKFEKVSEEGGFANSFLILEIYDKEYNVVPLEKFILSNDVE